MLAGIYFHEPFLFTHGMLCEVGGLDVLDIIRIGLTLLGKALGIKAIQVTPFDQMPVPFFMITLFHHITGMIVCFPVAFYLNDDRVIQKVVRIVLLFVRPTQTHTHSLSPPF